MQKAAAPNGKKENANVKFSGRLLRMEDRMKITLKDGSVKEYAQPMSVYEIAADISEGLARVACAGEVNGSG